MPDLPERGDLVARLMVELPELSRGTFATDAGELALNADPFPDPVDHSVEHNAASQPEQFIQFEFCLTYDGRRSATQIVGAPSPDLAAFTVGQFVALLNAWAAASGFPPLFAAIPGRCPLT